MRDYYIAVSVKYVVCHVGRISLRLRSRGGVDRLIGANRKSIHV
jgi:hypothetical protein